MKKHLIQRRVLKIRNKKSILSKIRLLKKLYSEREVAQKSNFESDIRIYIRGRSGTEGFEPPNSGTKTRCLTAWPRPI